MNVRGGAASPILPSSLAASGLALSAHPARLSALSAAPSVAGGRQTPAFAKALHAALAGPGAGTVAGRSGRPRAATDELDAAARQAAHLAPPTAAIEGPIQPLVPTLVSVSTPPAAPGPPAAPTSLEEILPALVRKIAWSGDARRGAVRIELGAGALAGATLLIAADGGRVQVTLSGQPDVDLDAWRERIATRLADRGLDADVT